jgi:hypothetical protein
MEAAPKMGMTNWKSRCSHSELKEIQVVNPNQIILLLSLPNIITIRPTVEVVIKREEVSTNLRL